MSGGISAGTLSMMSTGMMVAGTVSQGMAARNQSQATQQAYSYQAAVSANNAKLAEWQAQDALRRGATSEQQQRLKTAQLRGAQRARLAASGVAIDEGSALNTLLDTDFMGEQDAMTIRDNSKKEAWGARVQAGNYASDSSMLLNRADAENPNGAMFGTLLTGAGNVADSWYRRRAITAAPGRAA
jgi:hypothetical protein